MFRGEDRTIDRLLKAEAAMNRSSQIRESGPSQDGSAHFGASRVECAGFDPDMANAYVERALGKLEADRYELHLSGCPGCRSAVAQMALADNRSIYGAPAAVGHGRTLTVSRGLPAVITSVLLRPQWIVAMAAVIVILISIPVVFLRQKSGSSYNFSDQIASNKERPSESLTSGQKSLRPNAGSATEAVAGTPSGKSSGNNGSSTANLVTADEVQYGTLAARKGDTSNQPSEGVASAKDAEQKPSGPPAVANALIAQNSVAPTPATQPAAKVPASNSPAAAETGVSSGGGKQKSEQRQQAGPSKSLDRDATRQKTVLASARTEQGAGAAEANQKQSGRIDSKEALQAPQDQQTGQQSARVTVLKKGVPGGDTKQVSDKLATIKPQDSIAPQPKSTSADDGTNDTRRGIARAHSTNERTEAESVGEALVSPRSAPKRAGRSKIERKVEGKKFRLIDGVWTDKQYNPNREMPWVTVLRGSSAYDSLTEKEPRLKLYFSNFSPSERVIVVYKKVAYRLIPQPASDGTHQK